MGTAAPANGADERQRGGFVSDPLGTRPAPGPDQPPIPVRLITFNTHHGVGDDGRHDLPRLATVLAAADADLICLQDANALLSRLPILVSAVPPLPGSGEPRSALRTMVELDGAALWVTTTHLSTRSPEERAEQIAAIAQLHTEPMETGVLVGDFNAEPGAPELAALTGRFADAWELAPERDDQAGWRFWHAKQGGTHPARRPHRRIDHVWVSPGVGVASAHVLDAAGASDHLPLVVDLRVQSGV